MAKKKIEHEGRGAKSLGLKPTHIGEGGERLYGFRMDGENVLLASNETPEAGGLEFVRFYADSSLRPSVEALLRKDFVLRRNGAGFSVYRIL
jgi:hypothetical protein